mmetsp:Transcript_8690/g.12906  ORF Transcript_8690/g.12906 Transcript_8690/m.12906 type:complete len:96 (+) Transcript_8690:1075-1362(+)
MDAQNSTAAQHTIAPFEVVTCLSTKRVQHIHNPYMSRSLLAPPTSTNVPLMNFPNAVAKVAIIANLDANADDSEILFDVVRMWKGIQNFVCPFLS